MQSDVPTKRPSVHEQVLMLYGSFTRLDDLFKMQATGAHSVGSAEFDEALRVQQALSAIVQYGLSSDDEDIVDLRQQLLHSSITLIADIARAASSNPRH